MTCEKSQSNLREPCTWDVPAYRRPHTEKNGQVSDDAASDAVVAVASATRMLREAVDGVAADNTSSAAVVAVLHS